MSEMRITDHNDHSVEYETEGDNEPGYVSFTQVGGVVYVGIKTEFDEVEEVMTRKQALHLYRWLERNLLSGPGMGMIR